MGLPAQPYDTLLDRTWEAIFSRQLTGPATQIASDAAGGGSVVVQ